MPLMETVTIINKSGRVVSTGKHLVNIFKDAKDAYNDKKAEMRAEQHQKAKAKTAGKLLQAREETRSVTYSRKSHHSRSSRHERDRDGRDNKDKPLPNRPPLTERNLSLISESSVTSSRSHRSRSSHHGSRAPRSQRTYRQPYFENGDISKPDLTRAHTDHFKSNATLMRRPSLPPTLPRSRSDPDLHEGDNDPIDMNLAYGELPAPLPFREPHAPEREAELQATMSKLDMLLIEAHALQHTASSIISSLQANPQAMAAVALTLAELSNLLTKMSPGILAAIKSSSPAVFALLASPQFLIASGVAIGVTVVMFGGYKIIKKISASNEAKKEATSPQEALPYDGALDMDTNIDVDVGSIENWRRGIASAEAESIGTSVDGEFITPEAARWKKDAIRARKAEERRWRDSGVATYGSSSRSLTRVGSEDTLRTGLKRDVPARTSSSRALADASASASGKGNGKKEKEAEAAKKKKSSPLTVLFRKKEKAPDKEERERGRETEASHRPQRIEL